MRTFVTHAYIEMSRDTSNRDTGEYRDVLNVYSSNVMQTKIIFYPHIFNTLSK